MKKILFAVLSVFSLSGCANNNVVDIAANIKAAEDKLSESANSEPVYMGVNLKHFDSKGFKKLRMKGVETGSPIYSRAESVKLPAGELVILKSVQASGGVIEKLNIQITSDIETIATAGAESALSQLSKLVLYRGEIYKVRVNPIKPVSRKQLAQDIKDAKQQLSSPYIYYSEPSAVSDYISSIVTDYARKSSGYNTPITYYIEITTFAHGEKIKQIKNQITASLK